MFAARLYAPLAGILFCLLALAGCEQQPPDVTESQHQPEPPAIPPPAQQPAATAEPTEPPADKPGIESLVLTPDDAPFAEAPAHNFGEVPDAEWLAGPARRPARRKLLPDLFDESTDQDRVNVEGELLLDGSQGTSGMLDGIGMKIEINTD